LFWSNGLKFDYIQDKTFIADKFQYFKSGEMNHSICKEDNVFNSILLNSVMVDCITLDRDPNYSFISHNIDGHNLQKYIKNYGTLSFLIKSSEPGVYCIAFKNNTLSYVTQYEINKAHEWERKVITLKFNKRASDKNIWDCNDEIGLQIIFTLDSSKPFYGENNEWQKGDYLSTENQTNLSNSDLNTFWISQIKFELGDEATQFIDPDYATELYRLKYKEFQKLFINDKITKIENKLNEIGKEMEDFKILKKSILKSENFQDFRNEVIVKLFKDA